MREKSFYFYMNSCKEAAYRTIFFEEVECSTASMGYTDYDFDRSGSWAIVLYTSDKKVIYRDFKASNILLDIWDFDLMD